MRKWRLTCERARFDSLIGPQDFQQRLVFFATFRTKPEVMLDPTKHLA
jgi:hypothetical protein